jgi:hypothetical protein
MGAAELAGGGSDAEGSTAPSAARIRSAHAAAGLFVAVSSSRRIDRFTDQIAQTSQACR